MARKEGSSPQHQPPVRKYVAYEIFTAINIKIRCAKDRHERHRHNDVAVVSRSRCQWSVALAAFLFRSALPLRSAHAESGLRWLIYFPVMVSAIINGRQLVVQHEIDREGMVEEEEEEERERAIERVVFLRKFFALRFV